MGILARASPLVVARAISAIATFAIPLVLVRRLAPAEYGTYKQLLLVAQTIYYLLPAGMSQSLYYFVPRAASARPYLVQALSFLALMGAIGAGLLAAGGNLLADLLNNAAIAPRATMLAIYVGALLGSVPLEPAWTAQGKTGRAAVAYLASDVLKAAAMTVPALRGMGLDGVLTGLALFAVIRFVATWIAHGFGNGPLFERAAFRSQIRYALPIGASVALLVPQQALHPYLVSAGLDAATFAVYAVGTFQAPIFDLLYAPTSEMLMVRIAELERSGLGQAAAVFREAVHKLSLFFVPACAFLIAFAPEIISALFTDRYRAAVPVFRVAAAGGLLACLPVDGALRARRETRHIFFCSVLKIAVTLPLAIVGVARFGMLGGIGSWFAAEVVGKLALMFRLPRALGTPLIRLVPWAKIGRAAIASGLACAVTLFARAAVPNVPHSFLRLVGLGLVFALVAGGALAAMGEVRLPAVLQAALAAKASRWRARVGGFFATRAH